MILSLLQMGRLRPGVWLWSHSWKWYIHNWKPDSLMLDSRLLPTPHATSLHMMFWGRAQGKGRAQGEERNEKYLSSCIAMSEEALQGSRSPLVIVYGSLFKTCSLKKYISIQDPEQLALAWPKWLLPTCEPERIWMASQGMQAALGASRQAEGLQCRDAIDHQEAGCQWVRKGPHGEQQELSGNWNPQVET